METNEDPRTRVKIHVVVPRHKVVRYRVVFLQGQISEVLKNLELEELFPKCRYTCRIFTVSLNLSVLGFGTTPKRLTTKDLSPKGSIVTALTATISTTAAETKSE